MKRRKFLFQNEGHLEQVHQNLHKQFPQLQTTVSVSGTILFVESKGDFPNDREVIDFINKLGGILKPAKM